MHRALLALTALLASSACASSPWAAQHQAPVLPETGTTSETLGEPSGSFGRLHNGGKGRTSEFADTLKKYGDKVVVRIEPSTPSASNALVEKADQLELDVWEYTASWMDVRLAENDLPALLSALPDETAKYRLLMSGPELIDNIVEQYPRKGETHRGNRQQAMQTRKPAHSPQDREGAPSTQESNIFFNDYQPLSVIEPWMRLLSSLFNTHVRLITIGMSHEGRPINALRVGVHPTNNNDIQPRKTIIVSGGSHAREWVGTSTVNYVAYSFITGYGKNRLITKLLETFDFVFIPTINPDGYEYTWSTDRLWRKNRQPTTSQYCRGIDLDRAFGFQWESSTPGSPCSESYAGSQAFEATESKAYADWALNEAQNNNVSFVGFLELHSYSESILYPYSYSCTEVPPGLENLQELGYRLERAIRISGGHSYGIMPACEGNTIASDSSASDRNERPWAQENGGSALDYFYHELKIPYAYQIKLRDRGTYGFLLPKENIIPTGREILDAVVELAQFLDGLYGPEREAQVHLQKPNDPDDPDDPTPIESESRKTTGPWDQGESQETIRTKSDL